MQRLVAPGLGLLIGLACAAIASAADEAQSAPAPAAKPIAVTHQLSEAKSGDYIFDHEHSRIVWSISHHGYSSFLALLPDVSGKLSLNAAQLSRSHLEVSVNMASGGTLLPDFDERLKGAQYFNTAKFPVATFQSTSIQRVSGNALIIQGQLSFLGVTQPEQLRASFNQAGSGIGPGGYRIGFDGVMEISRSQFGMERSSIGDAVTLRIEAEFIEPSAGPE